VDGGLAPLPGDRADFVFSLVGSGSPPGALSVRLFAEDRLRGRVDGELGAPGVIQAGPFSSGWIAGSVEVDPDALRADDRRFFAFRVRPPVPVSGLDAAGPFVEEGLRVLEESGRVRLVAVGGEVLVRSGGGAVRSRSGASSILVLPPTDATLLPGLNRFLEELGTGWRFGASLEPGRLPLQSRGIPGLEGVEVMAGYRLLPSGANGRVLATTRNGEPWLVEGDGRGTRVLIASSPLHPGFTTLPVRAGMIPFLDWALTRWAAGSSPTSDVAAGDDLAPPAGATAVITPDAVRLEADAFGALGHRGSPGIYRFLAGDSLLAVVAVNVPARESDLTRAGAGPVASLAGRDGAVVASLEEWEGAIFRARTGPEGGGLLLALALMLLLVESLVAASGQTSRGEGVRPPTRGRSRGEARS
jgi:hypothetical protein